MRKITISVKVAKQQRMNVDAYLTEYPVGLAIHRAVVWVPAKQEHKFSSKWTITHLKSGYSVLNSSQYLPTMKACVELTQKLSGIPWESDSDDILEYRAEIMDAVNDTPPAGKPDELAVAKKRYVVRRSISTGYVVADTNDDSVVATFPHRGMAARKAKELSESSST